MARKITISDVAEKAGVTKSAVSMVFRNRPGISEATRRRVLDIAREMSFKPSVNANRRGGEFNGQIGFISVMEKEPRFGNAYGASYLNELAAGCIGSAETRNSSVALGLTTWDRVRSGEFPVALQRQQVDGVIICGWLLPELERFIKDAGIPVVLAVCDRDYPGFPHVRSDYLAGSSMLTNHLLSQGCRSLAVITGELSHVSCREHLAGVRFAAGERGVEVRPEALVIERGCDEASGHRGVASLLAAGVKFDALICQNDLIAAGAMSALVASGLRIPEDVLVAGFDNMEFVDRLACSLTSVELNCREIGQIAAELLLNEIDKRPTFNMQVRVPPVLIQRRSTLIDESRVDRVSK